MTVTVTVIRRSKALSKRAWGSEWFSHFRLLSEKMTATGTVTVTLSQMPAIIRKFIFLFATASHCVAHKASVFDGAVKTTVRQSATASTQMSWE
jgi:hypothetical protein